MKPQTVKDFLKSGGKITVAPKGKKAAKKQLTKAEIAKKNGLRYDSDVDMYIDEWDNWVEIGPNNQPNWDGVE